MEFPISFKKLSFLFHVGFPTQSKKLSYALCSLSLLLTAWSCHHEIPLNPHPNIILIMADDMGWGGAGFQCGNQQAFIDDQYKIYSSDKGGSFELYDIINDPEESSDLSLEFPEIKDTLINELNVWIKSCKQSNEGHDYH